MYGHVVGVGGDCQPAYQIRRITGRHEAHVFDWLLLGARSAARLIANDFEGWLAPQTLSLQSTPFAHVREAAYGVRFLHDFPLDPGFMAHAGAVRSKYLALAERWRMLLASEAAVLFVWHGCEGREAVAVLADALRGARAGRPFRLLALRTDLAEADWALPDVSNRFLAQPACAPWSGDDAAWDGLFGRGPG